jgi:Nucleoside 2-deoxyribosyltransferase like
MADTYIAYAQEPIPSTWDASVFLAGPTPRDPAVASWRPGAVDLLRDLWAARGEGRLVVFVPETSAGGMFGGWDAQVEWEDTCLNACDVIAFWVPRDLRTLPGFTTNVEWGRWEASGKVVLGAPPDAPKNRYLFHYAQRHGVPTAHTLPATMAAALDLVARRKGTVAP